MGSIPVGYRRRTYQRGGCGCMLFFVMLGLGTLALAAALL